ncbi:MAG: hemolysin family protein [Candidatus Omnitrophota bacterium]|jgi:CBS domain containing-hemolysin-like protein|nr:hemolysin family protein [Candidatus Omnitrophota bacterium]
MMIHLVVLKFVLLAVFLSLSAFFSASETALFSLDSIKIKRLSQSGRDTSRIVRLMDNPLRCLTTILAGNTLVNITIAAIMTSLLMDLFGQAGVSISIGVTTFILLLFGEVTPKTIAIHNNERLSYILSGPLYVFERFFRPFLFLSTKTCDMIISALGLQPKKEPTLTEEEFKTVIEVVHKHGIVGKNEKEMVVSILELTTTTAQEIMTPRMDIKAISLDWDAARVREAARVGMHSRFPVFKGSFDNIQGVVFAKELFLEAEKPLAEMVRAVMFVPATKRISDLIKDFYKQDVRIAVVVDEYGGTSGLVTLEDILEEIFGEIHDEFEAQEKMIESLDKGVFRLNGKAPVEEAARICGLRIKKGDFETMAGFLLDIFGKIPSEGESIQTQDGEFTVEKLSGRRIKSMILKKWA